MTSPWRRSAEFTLAFSGIGAKRRSPELAIARSRCLRRLSGGGFAWPQAIPDQEYRTAGDRGIRHIERRPVIAVSVKVQEVHHRAQRDAIDHVADRAAQHQCERGAEQ